MRTYEKPEALVIGEASNVVLGQKLVPAESDGHTPIDQPFESQD